MSTKIAYITDLHLDDQYPKDAGADTFQHWEIILKDLATHGVDKVVLGGDLGEPSSTAYFFDSLKGYAALLHLTLGNHDQFDNIRPYYAKAQQLQAQGALYYSFVEEGYKYIFLDSSSGRVPSDQVAWLQQELNSPHPILLFVHHPIFAATGTLVDAMFPLKEREQLQQLLLESAVEITVFCGHYHILHEYTQGNIKQYITPATSVQFDTESPTLRFHADNFGYRIIEVSPKGVQSTFLSFSL
ncbi:MAG: metallophosphoesterase [Aureispira sp.]